MEHDNETLYLSIKGRDIKAVEEHLRAGIKPEGKDPWSGKSAIKACLESLAGQFVAEMEHRNGGEVLRAKNEGVFITIAKLLLKHAPKDSQVVELCDHMMEHQAPYIEHLVGPEVMAGLVEKSKDNPELLFTLIANGRCENLELLLGHGADPNTVMDNHYKRSLIHAAVESPGVYEVPKRLRMVESLIEHGADVNAADAFGNVPLFCVRDLEVARVLLGAGARVGHINDEGKGVLMGAWRHNSSAECVAYLIDQGARIEDGPSLEELEREKKENTEVLRKAWRRKALMEQLGSRERKTQPRGMM